jgi:PPM family protein phosphatase
MTLALRYAVRSDVGLLREGNEDSAYAGPRLLAVADGMGGHAAGEVASAVAISALTDLDGDPPAGDLLDALAHAVARANQILHDMVSADPSIGGMGTTLTAMLWSGTRVALCHIGDSRAYVLSSGEMRQITHDHTLVQSLVDDGRISPDEAATHPQRSLLLRALDGTTEADPDLSVLEASLGDRFLLCSDGLSSVVSEDTLHRTLATVTEPDDAVLHLVELAIKGGGPDNITCIVADVVDSATAPRPPNKISVLAGAASNGSGRPMLRTDSPAGRAHVLTQTAPQAIVIAHDDPAPRAPGAGGPAERPRRRWPIVTSVLLLLLIVIAGGGYFGWRYTQNQFYVGTDKGEIAIFRGINQTLGGVHLSHVYQRTAIPVNRVPTTDQQSIMATINANGLADAQRIVGHIRSDYQGCVSAQQALAQFRANWATYHRLLRAYRAKYHRATPVRNKSGRVVARPPAQPKGTRPTVPADCPAAPTTSAGQGS